MAGANGGRNRSIRAGSAPPRDGSTPSRDGRAPADGERADVWGERPIDESDAMTDLSPGGPGLDDFDSDATMVATILDRFHEGGPPFVNELRPWITPPEWTT